MTTLDCEAHEEAPFCAGPSLRPCPNGTEVPETEECGTTWLNDTSALGVPDDEMYSCEETGECDDSCSPPARDDCLLEDTTTETTEPPPLPEELPATGPGDLAVTGALALATIAVGLAGVMAGKRGAP